MLNAVILKADEDFTGVRKLSKKYSITMDGGSYILAS